MRVKIAKIIDGDDDDNNKRRFSSGLPDLGILTSGRSLFVPAEIYGKNKIILFAFGAGYDRVKKIRN